MYTVSKGPSKIVAKTRRGITQNFERLESISRESKKNSELNGEVSLPKPVFQPVNGKKSHSFKVHQQETITPHHEEIIKFIHDSWTSVCKESEEKNGETKVVYFQCTETPLDLKDFKPFDLESWWGKRLFNTITKSVP